MVEQVGGNHYKDSEGVCPHCRGRIQHWDWAGRLPGLVYAATKYIARFRSKSGFQDLLKGESYLVKLIEQEYPAEWKEEQRRRTELYFMDNENRPLSEDERNLILKLRTQEYVVKLERIDG